MLYWYLLPILYFTIRTVCTAVVAQYGCLFRVGQYILGFPAATTDLHKLLTTLGSGCGNVARQGTLVNCWTRSPVFPCPNLRQKKPQPLGNFLSLKGSTILGAFTVTIIHVEWNSTLPLCYWACLCSNQHKFHFFLSLRSHVETWTFLTFRRKLDFSALAYVPVLVDAAVDATFLQGCSSPHWNKISFSSKGTFAKRSNMETNTSNRIKTLRFFRGNFSGVKGKLWTSPWLLRH